jgi:hypothetical protein
LNSAIQNHENPSFQSVNNIIKKWTGAINLEDNYGAHTLRKTRGYRQRTKYGMGFEIVCKWFNHSGPAITMRYLGIEDKEVHNYSTLMNEKGYGNYIQDK